MNRPPSKRKDGNLHAYFIHPDASATKSEHRLTKDLVLLFQEIFKTKSQFVVMFHSNLFPLHNILEKHNGDFHWSLLK